MKKVGSIIACCTLTCIAIDQQSLHSYFWANYQQFQGSSELAEEWYEKLTDTNESYHSYKGYIHFLFENQRFEKIYPLISQTQKQFKLDPDIQLIFISVLETLGHEDQAHEKLFNLNQIYPKNSEITFKTAQVYIQRKELDNAISVIDTFLQKSPRRTNNFIFYFLKAQIYIQLNKLEQALAAAKETIEIYPQFDKGWLLIGSLQEQVGQLKEAIDGYETFLSLTRTDNALIEQHLFELMLRQKLTEQKSQVSFLQKSCLDKALSLFNEQKYDETLKQLDECLKNDPLDKDARLLKIETLTAKNEYLTACNTLFEWINESPKEQLWIKTLHLLGINKNATATVIPIAQTLCKTHTENEWLPLYTADLFLRTHDYKNAYDYLEKSASFCSLKERRATIYYQQGLVAFEHGMHKKARKALERGYKDDPNFGPLLNLLGFYWATKGKNPDRGMHFIKKALSQEPNNHHYRDTYAFISYKQNNYQEAEEILTHLVSLHQKNSSMLLHLAKNRHKQTNNDPKAYHALIKRAEKYARSEYEKNRIAKFVKKVATL